MHPVTDIIQFIYINSAVKSVHLPSVQISKVPLTSNYASKRLGAASQSVSVLCNFNHNCFTPDLGNCNFLPTENPVLELYRALLHTYPCTMTIPSFPWEEETTVRPVYVYNVDNPRGGEREIM